jgi:hypothetical protein
MCGQMPSVRRSSPQGAPPSSHSLDASPLQVSFHASEFCLLTVSVQDASTLTPSTVIFAENLHSAQWSEPHLIAGCHRCMLHTQLHGDGYHRGWVGVKLTLCGMDCENREPSLTILHLPSLWAMEDWQSIGMPSVRASPGMISKTQEASQRPLTEAHVLLAESQHRGGALSQQHIWN